VRYAYPAIFTAKEVEGRGQVYTVEFPDMPDCITEGESILHAIEMAREALAECILAMQKRREAIPNPTPIEAVSHKSGFVSIVDLDMLEYKRKTDNRAIRRTVSLPRWLDVMAQDAGVNFSKLIQAALKEELGIQQQIQKG
jgi:predicted RNase H-like HicB family nuclease